MAKAGRKKKAGLRTAKGRLSRSIVATFDKGTDRAQLMQALYGQDCADALGRAFRTGLLGEGSDAKALLDMGRSIHVAYWQAYANGSFKSPIGDKTSGTVVDIDQAKALRREEWLNTCLDTVKRMGEKNRRAFYQLVIDVNPDQGPDWIDRLCLASRVANLNADPVDEKTLEHAIGALERLTA